MQNIDSYALACISLGILFLVTSHNHCSLSFAVVIIWGGRLVVVVHVMTKMLNNQTIFFEQESNIIGTVLSQWGVPVLMHVLYFDVFTDIQVDWNVQMACL